MEEIFKFTAQYGFPLVLSVYLLWRFEKKLNGLTKEINRLTKVMVAICAKSGMDISELIKEEDK